MTTSELIDRVQSFKLFRQDKVSFNSGELYTPANDAQNFILTSLRVIEGKCNLALAADQERYSFSTMTVSDASNASPIVITTTEDHPYNTGDTVILNGILGNTAANGRFTVTKVSDTTFSLDDSSGDGAYTSGGYAYHALQSAYEVFRIRKTIGGLLVKVPAAEFEQDRDNFGTSSAAAEVQRYMEIFEEDYTIGFQGTPSAAMTVECFYYRIPLPHERIAASVNPILPGYCDRALYYGTLKYLLENYDHEGKQQILREYQAEVNSYFDKELMRIAAVNAERKRPRVPTRSRLRI